ncbi:MAG: transporter substrate-binding domain-containing protein [Alphaproteobacteria bacterium]|nr:transporter substrate-binding domain-containing protein [Alphaproteobacteria bacterium]
MRYQIILIALLSVVISYVTATHVAVKASSRAVTVERESTLDRIMRTKTIRCGYVPYSPLILRDSITGEVSGIGADIHKRIAEMLGAKIEWTAETSWSTYIEDIRAGRYDMICNLDLNFPAYVGNLSTNLPVLYTIATAWVRPEDAARFLDKPVEQFNSPDITISAVDGTMPLEIARHDFPKAKILGMPSMTDYMFNLINVADKKADVTFVEKVFAEQFLKANPGKLINVTPPDRPLRVYAYSIPTLPGDTKMKEAMESAISYMVNNGEIDQIIRKYGAENGYYVSLQPYRPVR